MNYCVRIVSFFSVYSLLGFLTPSLLLGQTQCPADAPNGFTVEEVGDSCYIVFTWPKDEMPELTCGSPGTPVSGSSSFRGKLLSMTLESTTDVYDNGSNCSGSTFHFEYHPSLADSYITTRSYCDLTALENVSFVCNRTQGSNFTCDQTNNGPANAPMPIGLSEFFAFPDKNGRVQVRWSTEWEENNKAFQVERSQNGKQFVSIHYQVGSGDSYLPQEYFYEDTDPLVGLSYYRLKQTDYDGQFSYSKIISVQSTSKSNWNCYPTVTNGMIYINGKTALSHTTNIRVIDIFGRAVLPLAPLQEGENAIDLSSLEAGSYIVLLLEDLWISSSYRIIKQ